MQMEAGSITSVRSATFSARSVKHPMRKKIEAAAFTRMLNPPSRSVYRNFFPKNKSLNGMGLTLADGSTF
jgi:hypothetical protein